MIVDEFNKDNIHILNALEIPILVAFVSNDDKKIDILLELAKYFDNRVMITLLVDDGTK